MSGSWSDKWKKAGTVAVEAVAVAAEKVGVVEQRPVNSRAPGAAEMKRRAELNARGEAIRAERAATIDQLMGTGRRAWIRPMRGWMARGR